MGQAQPSLSACESATKRPLSDKGVQNKAPLCEFCWEEGRGDSRGPRGISILLIYLLACISSDRCPVGTALTARCRPEPFRLGTNTLGFDSGFKLAELWASEVPTQGVAAAAAPNPTGAGTTTGGYFLALAPARPVTRYRACLDLGMCPRA